MEKGYEIQLNRMNKNLREVRKNSEEFVEEYKKRSIIYQTLLYRWTKEELEINRWTLEQLQKINFVNIHEWFWIEYGGESLRESKEEDKIFKDDRLTFTPFIYKIDGQGKLYTNNMEYKNAWYEGKRAQSKRNNELLEMYWKNHDKLDYSTKEIIKEIKIKEINDARIILEEMERLDNPEITKEQIDKQLQKYKEKELREQNELIEEDAGEILNFTIQELKDIYDQSLKELDKTNMDTIAFYNTRYEELGEEKRSLMLKTTTEIIDKGRDLLIKLRDINYEKKLITPIENSQTYCNATINEKPLYLVIDSGSSTSAISREFAETSGIEITDNRWSIINTVVEADRKTRMGTAKDVPININGIIIPITMDVLEATIYEALIGGDFLRKVNGYIDFGSKTLGIEYQGRYTSCVISNERPKFEYKPLDLKEVKERRERIIKRYDQEERDEPSELTLKEQEHIRLITDEILVSDSDDEIDHIMENMNINKSSENLE